MSESIWNMILLVNIFRGVATTQDYDVNIKHIMKMLASFSGIPKKKNHQFQGGGNSNIFRIFTLPVTWGFMIQFDLHIIFQNGLVKNHQPRYRARIPQQFLCSQKKITKNVGFVMAIPRDPITS